MEDNIRSCGGMFVMVIMTFGSIPMEKWLLADNYQLLKDCERLT